MLASTRRARLGLGVHYLLLCIRPPSFWSGRRPPRSPPSEKTSLIPTAEPGRSCPTAGVDVRRLLTLDGWSSGCEIAADLA